MKTTNSSWTSSTFKLLLVAALPVHVCGYKILAIPIPAKGSHVAVMAAVADGLANRGHEVTFFVGENYQLNVPELRNRAEISVVRYNDAADLKPVSKITVKQRRSLAAT